MESRQETRSISGCKTPTSAGSTPALSDISAVGSAPDLGSGGRQFETDISGQR